MTQKVQYSSHFVIFQEEVSEYRSSRVSDFEGQGMSYFGSRKIFENGYVHMLRPYRFDRVVLVASIDYQADRYSLSPQITLSHREMLFIWILRTIYLEPRTRGKSEYLHP